jgi:hypothetical protein
MRLFPEVRPDRGFDLGSGAAPDTSTPGPETTNGAVPAFGDGSAVVNPGRLGSHNRPESSPTRTRTTAPISEKYEAGKADSAPDSAFRPDCQYGIDPDLARLVDVWQKLPVHIRAAILALIESANPRVL